MISKTPLALCVYTTAFLMLVKPFDSTYDCTDSTGECDTHSRSGAIYKEIFNLKSHLRDFKVSDRVYALLESDGISVSDLTKFRIKDLDKWCDENSLKAIEQTRFIEAVKALPNAQANEPITEPPIIKLYLGKEEQEQIEQFKKMEQNINTLIEHINVIDQLSERNTNNLTQSINDACDKLETFVKQLRKDLLNQVS